MTNEEIESLRSDAPECIHYDPPEARGNRTATAKVNNETLTWSENEVLDGVWEKTGDVNHSNPPEEGARLFEVSVNVVIYADSEDEARELAEESIVQGGGSWEILDITWESEGES